MARSRGALSVDINRPATLTTVTQPGVPVGLRVCQASFVEILKRLAAVAVGVWMLVAVYGAGSAIAATGGPVAAVQIGAQATAAGTVGPQCYERPRFRVLLDPDFDSVS